MGSNLSETSEALPSTRDIEDDKVNENNSQKIETLSIISIYCRICYNESTTEPLTNPCFCKGTMAYVHVSCLERWLAESNTSRCELCLHEYKTDRSTRYTASASIRKYLCSTIESEYGFARNLRNDLFVCCVLIPVAIIGSYVCIITADYYHEEIFETLPAARYTPMSLLLLMGLIIIGFYIWIFLIIRYHIRVWYRWWQHDTVVTLILPGKGADNIISTIENYNDYLLVDFSHPTRHDISSHRNIDTETNDGTNNPPATGIEQRVDIPGSTHNAHGSL